MRTNARRGSVRLRRSGHEQRAAGTDRAHVRTKRVPVSPSEALRRRDVRLHGLESPAGAVRLAASYGRRQRHGGPLPRRRTVRGAGRRARPGARLGRRRRPGPGERRRRGRHVPLRVRRQRGRVTDVGRPDVVLARTRSALRVRGAARRRNGPVPFQLHAPRQTTVGRRSSTLHQLRQVSVRR